MTKIKALMVFLLFHTVNGHSQQNSDSLINSFRSYVQTNEDGHASIFWHDEARMSYYSLIVNCANKQLIRLTSDSNAVIRSYSFTALLLRNVDKKTIRSILDAHKKDTAKFTQQSTDVVITWAVNDFMQSLAKPKAKPKGLDYKKEIEKIKNQMASKLKTQMRGSQNGSIKKEDILNCDTLALNDEKLRIASFSLMVSEDFFEGSSNILTKDMKSAIAKAGIGAKLCLFNIKVYNEGKWPRLLDSSQCLELK